MNRGDIQGALLIAEKSLRLAEKHEMKKESATACLKLSELFERSGNSVLALHYLKAHNTYRDKLNIEENSRRMVNEQTRFELSDARHQMEKKDKEAKDREQLLIIVMVALGLAILVLGLLIFLYRAIVREKKKSESLLLNILPAAAAQELKQNGRVEAVKFEQVTVLFTDFVDFSKLAEQVEPELLVKSIDAYFKKFDEITSRHKLEKIKTIGDSYMCASGLPTPNPAHAWNAVQAAREMMEFVKSKRDVKDGYCHFDIRIGIHTGPVVAGIVGLKKWQYDIWGDTVNLASRMESMSKPGRINISETTWNEVKEEIVCEYRGELEVKNRGFIKMYFLSEVRTLVIRENEPVSTSGTS
jgi:class 3 adenylate cyclase